MLPRKRKVEDQDKENIRPNKQLHVFTENPTLHREEVKEFVKPEPRTPKKQIIKDPSTPQSIAAKIGFLDGQRKERQKIRTEVAKKTRQAMELLELDQNQRKDVAEVISSALFTHKMLRA